MKCPDTESGCHGEPTKVSVADSDLTSADVIERHADSVLLVDTDAGPHVLVVEAQVSGDRREKRRSWPFYIAALHNRYDAQVTLLVICSDTATERWARRPITIGLDRYPSQTTTPLVLGPGTFPAVVSTEQAAADITMAVLSAIVHRHSPGVEQILTALAGALETTQPRSTTDLAALTAVGLTGSDGQKIWRELMHTFETRTFMDDWRDKWHDKWRAEAIAEGKAEGEAKGEATALLRVLSTRGIAVPAELRDRITGCTDTDLLTLWIERAVTATTIDDVVEVETAR